MLSIRCPTGKTGNQKRRERREGQTLTKGGNHLKMLSMKRTMTRMR